MYYMRCGMVNADPVFGYVFKAQKHMVAGTKKSRVMVTSSIGQDMRFSFSKA